MVKKKGYKCKTKNCRRELVYRGRGRPRFYCKPCAIDVDKKNAHRKENTP